MSGPPRKPDVVRGANVAPVDPLGVGVEVVRAECGKFGEEPVDLGLRGQEGVQGALLHESREGFIF